MKIPLIFEIWLAETGGTSRARDGCCRHELRRTRCTTCDQHFSSARAITIKLVWDMAVVSMLLLRPCRPIEFYAFRLAAGPYACFGMTRHAAELLLLPAQPHSRALHTFDLRP